MKCPFCEAPLNIKGVSLEELHYDCPACGSSLFFEKGECQILSEGVLPGTSVSGEEVTIEEEEAPPFEEASQTVVEEKADTSLVSQEEDVKEKFSSAKTSKEEVIPPSASQKKVPGETTSPATTQEKVEEEITAGGVPFVDESTLPSDLESSSIKKERENQANISSSSSSSSSEKEGNKNQTSQRKKSKQASLKEKSKEPEDFSDVEKFGNTTGNTHQGPFYYNLFVGEINSKEAREHLEYVLSDEALNLPPVEIKNGALRLNRLTPAATHVIVKALMGWPLKISWEQELVVDHEPESKSESDLESSDSESTD